MNPRSHLPVFFAVVLATSLFSPAQVTDDSDAQQPPPGSTVITSDELHSDQNTHISIFTGNVIVVGTNFHMTCQEMTVYFTPANKVQRIVSTGDVVITQPERVTTCGHAVYTQLDDSFDLTDQPRILDGKNTYFAPEIVIYRTAQKMTMKGGRSHVILGPDSTNSPKGAPSSPSTNDK